MAVTNPLGSFIFARECARQTTSSTFHPPDFPPGNSITKNHFFCNPISQNDRMNLELSEGKRIQVGQMGSTETTISDVTARAVCNATFIVLWSSAGVVELWIHPFDRTFVGISKSPREHKGYKTP
jgi:hypothetical protein